MKLVTIGQPAMNVLSREEVAKQASEFAVKGLASQIIELGTTEKQAVAIEKALKLELMQDTPAARAELIRAGFSEKFIAEFQDVVSERLSEAA